MAQFHFIEDYEKLVARLVEAHPIDEAMAPVVGGGNYEIFGQMEAEILQAAGLEDGKAPKYEFIFHRGLSIPSRTAPRTW